MTVVVGTAGHIDHGKTTLLRALTGIDADRLPEERARGMTIDVGYAHLALPDGTELDFVDVPGHDRLVGNMLVGAGEIDAAMLVIAADDGPRPQTMEHLELLDTLGIAHGLVVVTKVDTVDPERLVAVVDQARALVAPTRLAGADAGQGAGVLAVSATTGDGLEALRSALVALRDRVEAGREPAADGPCRLAIDRVFSIRGRGRVVTGTLRGGSIERGAVLRVVPGPDGRTIRVREVQVHGRAVDRAEPGRVALNIAGEGGADLERGTVLTTDRHVLASDRLLVALRPSTRAGPRAGEAGGAGGPDCLPPDRAPVVVHLGTARVAAAVGRSGRDAVDLGAGEGTAILRLERPIAVVAGDRFVLRRPSPVETLGGGRVLDPRPARGIARRRTTPDRLRALADAPAGSDAWQAARVELHGVLEGPPAAAADVAADVTADLDGALIELAEGRPAIRIAELTRAVASRLRRRVGGFGSSAELEANAVQRIVTGRLDALVAAGRLQRDADRILLPGVAGTGQSAAVAAAMERLVAALSTASPPSLAAAARKSGCPPEGIRLLEHANRIVRLEDDLAWAEPAWRDLAARALAMAARAPLTPAAYRDATGSSRKYVVALLEDLDRRAILTRTPAGHVPGPRAPSLAATRADRPGAPQAVVSPDPPEDVR